MKLVLGTHNKGKRRELLELLAGLPIELLTLDDFPGLEAVEETGTTFEENAALKARAGAEATGLWCLADDSGLEVDALEGAPGVYSARYARGGGDRANRQRLREALANVPDGARGARFVCVMALASPEGRVVLRRGTCEGEILREERGTGGFGYDPLFLVPPLGRTMAELRPEEKNGVSHRGKALRAMQVVLEGLLEGASSPTQG